MILQNPTNCSPQAKMTSIKKPQTAHRRATTFLRFTASIITNLLTHQTRKVSSVSQACLVDRRRHLGTPPASTLILGIYCVQQKDKDARFGDRKQYFRFSLALASRRAHSKQLTLVSPWWIHIIVATSSNKI